MVSSKYRWGQISMLAILAVYGCSGGSSTPPPSPPPASPPPPPPPPPPPVTTCDGLDLLNIVAATDDGTSAAPFGPDNAIDDNLAPDSRWESQTFDASITFDLGGPRLVRELGLAWFLGDQRMSFFNVAVSDDGTTFTDILTSASSAGDTLEFERVDVPDTAAQFVRLTVSGNDQNNDAALVEASVFGCSLDPTPVSAAPVAPINASVFGLDPSVPPGDNFDLLTWSLDTPRDDDGNLRADRTSETALDAGFVDTDFFFTGDDGGLVFRSTIEGFPTSPNTRFNRSELREMLRRGDTSISTQGANLNNWALGYQPTNPAITHGGRNGVLRATLAINNVTVTGTNQHVGRTIIGQIHAESDEPLRLYYKKFPDSERGYIYMAHEIRDSDDIRLTVVGPENPDIDDEPIIDGADPINGIALNELFSYEIIQDGSRIDVIVRRGDQDGEIIGHNFVDMDDRNSGYDLEDEWMYFRAGAYTQNDSGDLTDFDRITFYRIENTHD